MRTNRGFGLMEIVVGIAVIATAIVAGFSVIQVSLAHQAEGGDRVRAELLLQEGTEALRLIRDSGWSQISVMQPGTDYWLDYVGNTWNVSDTEVPRIFGKFERKFRVSQVKRDASGNIVDVGTVDPNIMQADMSVSWPTARGTETRTRTIYVAKIF